MNACNKDYLSTSLTQIPVLRAGLANVVIILLAIFISFWKGIVSNFNLPNYVLLLGYCLITFVFIILYIQCVCKICIEDGNTIALTCSIFTKRFRADHIERITVSLPGRGILIIVRGKGKRIPFIYLMNGLSNHGLVNGTVTKLLSMLKELGCEVKLGIGTKKYL